MKQTYNPYQNGNSQNRTNSTFVPQAGPQNAARTSPTIKHKSLSLPKNYVDIAEDKIKTMVDDLNVNKNKPITTTKLRNLFGLFSDIFNQCLRLDGNELTEEQMSGIQSARVRIVYECGRDSVVKTFVNKTNMLEYLYDIDNSKDKLMDYYHYLEALVAYARFYKFTYDEK